MSGSAKKFASEHMNKKSYTKALFITGGVVLALWAIRRVPWKKVVNSDTVDALKDTLVSVTGRLEEMAKEYMNGPVANVVGHTKKAAEAITNTSATH